MASTRTFADHRGARWGFQVIRDKEPQRSSPRFSVAAENLVRQPFFRARGVRWKRRVAESKPDSVDITFPECGPGGLRCARISHGSPADSWLVQGVVLDANTTYEISTEARAEGVGAGSAGAYLSLVRTRGLQTADLRGDSGWHHLRMFVTSGDQPAVLGVAVRFGDYGRPSTGTAWFTAVDVHAVEEVDQAAPSYSLAAKR